MERIGTLGFYIEQTSKYKQLTQERELDLIKKAQNGDKIALEELIHANLWFVVHLVKRFYFNKGLEDHIQNGSIGLLKAVEKYNPLKHAEENKKPVRFKNYAHSYIWSHISRGLPSEYRFKNGAPLQSIDENFSKEGKPLTIISDLKTDIKTQEEIELTDERRHAINLLNYLNERERKVIEMRYGIGCDKAHSLREIGDQFNLTKERIRQIEGKALRKLRESI